MNWDAIGAIAELLGAIGVIASLIYLARQIRDGQRALRASTYQQFREEIRESHSNMLPISEARVVRLGLADFSQLNDDEAFQFNFWANSVIPVYENAYYLYRAGMLDDDRWEMQRRNLVQMLGNPGLVLWWRTMPPTMSPEFVALVEEILGEEPEGGIGRSDGDAHSAASRSGNHSPCMVEPSLGGPICAESYSPFLC
jgi:hypothetical protein